ncbi:MAG: PfkB family carbohydrate kinase [Candidatus Peribacteraceae bacterium]|jgi:1-phosphofructokinase family hexose kinase
MILAAGLTPSWQQICVLDDFQPGEVNRAQQVLWCASAKVCNVGIAIQHLGGSVLLLAPIGGVAANAIQKELDVLEVPHRLIPTKSPTRVCTTILDRKSGVTTEVVENAYPLLPFEVEAFRSAYFEEAQKAKIIVLSGSLPEGTTKTFYRDLAMNTRCPLVLDCRGPELLEALGSKPFVVKPNRDELGMTVGHHLNSENDVLAAMRMLNERGAQWVVVTHGSHPVLVSSLTGVYRLSTLPVANMMNPIGSGDALAATIAWGATEGHSLIESIRFGIAAAAQNVSQLLPCRINPVLLEAQAALVNVERL